MAYKVPPLRFAYDALEPYIHAETMETPSRQTSPDVRRQREQGDRAVSAPGRSHDRRPAASSRPGAGVDPDGRSESRRNHGGGHANHQFFWDILGRKAGDSPKGAIADAITKDFGSFERFQSVFTTRAMGTPPPEQRPRPDAQPTRRTANANQ